MNRLVVTQSEYSKIHRLATRHDLTDTLWVEGLTEILGAPTVRSLMHKSTRIEVDPQAERITRMVLIGKQLTN